KIPWLLACERGVPEAPAVHGDGARAVAEYVPEDAPELRGKGGVFSHDCGGEAADREFCRGTAVRSRCTDFRREGQLVEQLRWLDGQEGHGLHGEEGLRSGPCWYAARR